MKKCDCPYCAQGEYLAKFGVLAFETKTSEVIVFKEQLHPGRAIVAYKNDHVGGLEELNDQERNDYMKDVADVCKAIKKAYKPDRINFGAYGDTLGHLHIHIVPKYKDQYEWGGTFAMNTNKYASDSEIEEVIKKIKDNM